MKINNVVVAVVVILILSLLPFIPQTELIGMKILDPYEVSEPYEVESVETVLQEYVLMEYDIPCSQVENYKAFSFGIPGVEDLKIGFSIDAIDYLDLIILTESDFNDLDLYSFSIPHEVSLLKVKEGMLNYTFPDDEKYVCMIYNPVYEPLMSAHSLLVFSSNVTVFAEKTVYETVTEIEYRTVTKYEEKIVFEEVSKRVSLISYLLTNR